MKLSYQLHQASGEKIKNGLFQDTNHFMALLLIQFQLEIKKSLFV